MPPPVQSLDDEEGTPALAAAGGDAGAHRDVVRCRAWSEDLADSYLALCRVDDAVRMISDATRSGHAEGDEMLCEPAEKLMRSGYEPLPGQAPVAVGSRRLPDDVRVHVHAGIGYGDIGDHAGAREWPTTALELALRTGSALEQLRPLRASCLSALRRPPDEIQAQGEQGKHG